MTNVADAPTVLDRDAPHVPLPPPVFPPPSPPAQGLAPPPPPSPAAPALTPATIPAATPAPIPAPTPASTPATIPHAAPPPAPAGPVTDPPTVPTPAAPSPTISNPAPAAAVPTPAQFVPVVPDAPAAPPPSPPQAAPGRPAPAGIPDYTALVPATAKKPRRRRSFGKLVVAVAVLGGLGAAGYVYGPEALERVRAELREDDATAPDPVVEPEAPFDFPTPTAPPLEVRNATFVIADVDPEGAARRYEITTDFENRISHVFIDRQELPTLEVMTFLDSAVVRRVDDETWYQTARGQFPLDDQLERDRWVRHLDELIPVVNRSSAAIEASTTALLAGERMRHLVVTIDPEMLAGPSLSTDWLQPPGVPISQAIGIDTRPAEGGVTGAPDAPSTVTDAAPGPVPAETGAEIVAEPATPAASAPRAPISIELWIDSRGLVRQLITPEALGGETLTVTAVSPDTWIPEFPPEERIEPLTASALVDLGL